MDFFGYFKAPRFKRAFRNATKYVICVFNNSSIQLINLPVREIATFRLHLARGRCRLVTLNRFNFKSSIYYRLTFKVEVTQDAISFFDSLSCFSGLTGPRLIIYSRTACLMAPASSRLSHHVDRTSLSKSNKRLGACRFRMLDVDLATPSRLDTVSSHSY